MQGERYRPVIRQNLTDRLASEAAFKQAPDELARVNTQLERKVEERTAQLREANANLQSFAYTPARGLRYPLLPAITPPMHHPVSPSPFLDTA